MISPIDYALEDFDDFERMYRKAAPGGEFCGRMQGWLRNEFVLATNELFQNQAFRDACDRWYLQLTPGSTSALRAMLEEAAACIQGYARELAEFIGPTSSATAPIVEERHYATLRRIAEERAPEVFRAEEYFGVADRAPLSPDFQMLEAALCEVRSPEPRPGDCILAGAAGRLLRSQAALDAVFRRIGRDPADPAYCRLLAAKNSSEQCIAVFLAAAQASASVTESEAAATLLQARLVADELFVPEWLPFQFDRRVAVQRSRNVFHPRDALPDGSDARFQFNLRSGRWIASALNSCKGFLLQPDDPEARIERAVRGADLVLVDRPSREAYWKGREILPDAWNRHERLWNLLWTLASHPGASVDRSMLSGPDRHPMKSRVHRLGKLLNRSAPELVCCIESVPVGCYRFLLPASKVVLLRDDGFGRLIDVSPRNRLRGPHWGSSRAASEARRDSETVD